MNELFAAMYESLFGVYNANYLEIFTTLFDFGGYLRLGFLFIGLPLLFWLLFYYLWKYPYGRFLHWLVWLLASAVTVLVATWLVADHALFDSGNQALADALGDAESGYKAYAEELPMRYALINAGLSLAVGFMASLVMKQFSRIQMHLPF